MTDLEYRIGKANFGMNIPLNAPANKYIVPITADNQRSIYFFPKYKDFAELEVNGHPEIAHLFGIHNEDIVHGGAFLIKEKILYMYQPSITFGGPTQNEALDIAKTLATYLRLINQDIGFIQLQ